MGFASAFVDTQLGFSMSFGHTAFDTVDERDDTPYRAELAGVAQRLDLGVRILPRLALTAAVGGRISTGINAPTVLKLGAEGGLVWRVGVAGVIARIERTGTQVGARLSIEGEEGGRFVSLERLVDDAIDDQSVPSAEDLFGGRSALTGRFSWSAAQAIGRHLSVQASIGWGRTWRSSSTRSSSLQLDGGFAITVDAAPFVPLAALFECSWSALLHRGGPWPAGPLDLLSNEGGSTLFGGLYYSGRPDLLLGVLGGASMPASPPERSIPQGRFELRCFF